MIWDFGKTYKRLRKAKKISLKDICADVISTSTLSRIENYNQIPNFETMQYLLKQINVSFDEFEFLCNSYSISESDKIISEFLSIVSDSDSAKIVNLQKRCEHYLKKDRNLKIEEINILLNSFIEKKGQLNKQKDINDSDEVSVLLEKITNIDLWTYEDIRIFNCLFHRLSLDELEELIPKALSMLKRYEGFKEVLPLSVSILLNFSTVLLHKRKMKDCYSILSEAHQLNNKLKRVDFLGVIYVRKGICLDDEIMLNKGLSILEHSNEFYILDEMKKEINKYTLFSKSE